MILLFVQRHSYERFVISGISPRTHDVGRICKMFLARHSIVLTCFSHHICPFMLDGGYYPDHGCRCCSLLPQAVCSSFHRAREAQEIQKGDVLKDPIINKVYLGQNIMLLWH